MIDNQEKLEKFIEFCQQHITGQERKEAQIFLDRFFQAFGYQGALEAGAKYEEAIKKGSKKKNTGFADLVWKPKLLIEMKKRGENLNKHYPQAFEYWSRLVPNRPRYVILCNFDEFWIFDFDLQLDEPVDIVALQDLAKRQSAFNFMNQGEIKSIFNNNQVEVTEKAGRRLGELFQTLQQRLNSSKESKSKRLKIQRFILQCVLAMFAEDRGLLPDSLFIRCVEECLVGASSYDVLGGLFREMNNHGVTSAGKYKDVAYFNGGLFATVEAIELTKPELEILATVARQDWSKVRPAIFGNIFEGTVNEKQRHSYGIHYTSEADIMKIVRPTISKYWEDLIDNANTIKKLNDLQLKLQSYRVLDPACGSGNFLYVAYQELKRIEQLILDKIASKSRKENLQTRIGFVTPNQFFGMDINPFAVELAKVTLMIARKVAIDKLNLTEPALPLDSLDNNILCTDALFTEWVKADAIIGNPPFLGGSKIRLELGDEYTETIFKKFLEIKDQVDFCVYWFKIAHDSLIKTGRAGLVGTNSISQGKSRKASLDFITHNNGYIHEAISTQVWSGEANVHVSIVNWCKVIPDSYFLDNQIVKNINSSLTSATDISNAQKLVINKDISFQGVMPVGKDFIISKNEVEKWIDKDAKNSKVLKLNLTATDLAKNPHGNSRNWIIDFNQMSLEDASEYTLPFNHLKTYVKPIRDKNRDKKTREYWWIFPRTRPAMRSAIENLKYYFVVPETSKWFIFLVSTVNCLPNKSVKVVASEDFYVLGILTSKIHRIWVKAQSSTLEDRTRYTHTTCFETFPFPQLENALFSLYSTEENKKEPKIIEQIRAKMTELHEYRTEQMEKKQWGITKLYNAFFDEPSSKLYRLHQQLDELVMKAYGFDKNENLLAQILALNLKIAEAQSVKK